MSSSAGRGNNLESMGAILFAPVKEWQGSGQSKVATSGRSGRGIEPELIFTAGMVIFRGHFVSPMSRYWSDGIHHHDLAVEWLPSKDLLLRTSICSCCNPRGASVLITQRATVLRTDRNVSSCAV